MQTAGIDSNLRNTPVTDGLGSVLSEHIAMQSTVRLSTPRRAKATAHPSASVSWPLPSDPERNMARCVVISMKTPTPTGCPQAIALIGT